MTTSGKWWGTYEEHAGPESIAYALRNARRRLADAQREVAHLEALRDQRQAQIEAGEWPTTRTLGQPNATPTGEQP